MNKIYKVIYSKVRNCYVVVSELAKNNGKGTSRGAVVGSPKRTSLLAAVLAAMAFGALPGIAAAADPAIVTDVKGNIVSTDAKIKDQISEDPGSFPQGGGQSIAIGKGATAFMQGGWKASFMLFGGKKPLVPSQLAKTQRHCLRELPSGTVYIQENWAM
ncbi:ESPR domain-containing protein [Acidaminococcus timonensis]|uniref:ESPR domain-containing protein n=1 Tax=Acidaminococcus timonensis TaxID=1871002 RepID=UPI00307D8FF4